LGRIELVSRSRFLQNQFAVHQKEEVTKKEEEVGLFEKHGLLFDVSNELVPLLGQARINAV
jgi:hypothetical protein